MWFFCKWKNIWKFIKGYVNTITTIVAIIESRWVLYKWKYSLAKQEKPQFKEGKFYNQREISEYHKY
jgi:hypothetical protein